MSLDVAQAAFQMLDGGPVTVTSIIPDGRTDTRVFHTSETLAAWAQSMNGKENCYWHSNPVRNGIGTGQNGKVKKSDIEKCTSVWTDVDARIDESPEECKHRTLGSLERLCQENDIPLPNWIVDSGNGIQLIWKLSEPVPVKEGEETNQALINIFEGDNSAKDGGHLLRSPDTENIPDARKRKKGRTRVPSKLLRFDLSELANPSKMPRFESSNNRPPAEINIDTTNTKRYSVDDLKWGVPDRLKVVIVQGHDPEKPKEGDNSRSAWLFDVVCNLLRLGVPPEVVFSIITDPEFGISESVLEQKDPTKYAVRQIERAEEEAVDPWLREMNDKFAVVGNFGGKCRVVEELEDPNTGRRKLTFSSFEDFRNRFMHLQVAVGTSANGKPQLQALGAWWLKQPKRRQYKTIVFAPGREVEGAYNLWQGFAVEARKGDCSQFLDHTRENICSGDKTLYDYLIPWMARTVQEPGSQGEVAIVLRGGRGVGKSIWANLFGSLFGAHYLQISASNHLTGNFNRHLWDNDVLFADEAFYAGDKKHESNLKALITESSRMIEPKGVDPFSAPNFTHLIMAGNDAHLVPAGLDERRFFALDVGNGRQKDTEYFAALVEQMEDGGREALLYHLLHEVDLKGFEVRNVPTTAALESQKRYSLVGAQRVVHDLLSDGAVHYIDEREDPEFQGVFVATNDLLGRANVRANVTALGRELARISHSDSSFRVSVDGKQRRGFWLLPLDQAREAWAKGHGLTIRWPDAQDPKLWGQSE